MELMVERLSISQLSTIKWWLEEDAIRFSSHGFKSIAVWREKLTDESIDFATSLFADLDLSVSSLQWAGGFTGSDGRSHVDAIEDAIDAIRQAARIRAPKLLIHSGARGCHTLSHCLRLFRTALNELVPVAQDFGIQLVVVPMATKTGKSFTFVQDFESALEYCASFQRKDIGLALNLFHFPSQFEILDNEEFVKRLALVQISDRVSGNDGSHRALLGTGQTDLIQWLSRLRRCGYDGTFEVEIYSPELQSTDYFERLSSIRDYWQVNVLKKSIV